jgi:hypothetical protein
MEAFQQRAVTFVPETTYLRWNTGFPAVTVCEKLNRQKIWNLTGRFVLAIYTHTGKFLQPDSRVWDDT